MTERTYDAVVAAPGFSLGIRCDGEDWVEEIEFIEPHREQKARTPLAAEVARQLGRPSPSAVVRALAQSGE